MIQTQETSSSQTSGENEETGANGPRQVLEGDFKLGTRENIAFSVLLVMSFYAALESTAIGVALPASLPSRNPFLNIHLQMLTLEITEHSTRHPWFFSSSILDWHIISTR
jgi:hypothetical protein